MKRILVVEDDERLQKLLARFLGSSGYSVDVASEKEEAQALLGSIRYEVILADVQLTELYGREGLELAIWLSQNCPWAALVVMTGHATKEVEREALRCGAKAFLTKPVSLEQLGALISELVDPASASSMGEPAPACELGR